MKLSVSAFRAQASAQRKILSSYQSQLNYGACNSFPALGGYKFEEKTQMMVDSSGISQTTGSRSNECSESLETSPRERENVEGGKIVQEKEKSETEKTNATGSNNVKREEIPTEKSSGRNRSKSNQRWMKLRTTVQLSGAISSTNQKSKPPLKREDSFLKRFSTRQIPETQETVDTGDETETLNGSQTQSEVNRRRRKRRKEMSKTVVNPDENFYFYWLMTVTVCVLYNLWTLIVRQSFPELQKGASSFWYSGDGLTDVVFICDIIVQFRTGYLEQGLMVYNSKKLATHYLKSRAFILDILSLLPLDFLQINIGVNPILRFPRFLKIYRVYNYYYMVESRTVYPNLWRVVNLIHILLILAHWFGCFYYLLSEAEGFQGDWVYPYRPGDYATLTRKYLGSLYWSTLTLTTIGDLPTPETNAESRGRSKAMTTSGQSEGIPRRGHKSRLLQFNSNYGYLFTIISYLIGVFIFATIVGQVGNVITNRNANRLEFERLLDGAKTYMRHHKVPGGMKRRVLRWYDYSWSRGRIQGGGDINTALGLLPDKLKTELALHVNLSVLKKVTIFQECQPEFLHDLVLKMKAYIFTPGDLICRKGEVAREMFIIADGILDVISETGRVLTTMKAGDFFGEIGILNLDGLNKRTADVRSVGYSELFSLSREDVLSAMKDYPEAQEILQSLGRKRLMEAKNISKSHKAQVKQIKDYDSSGESDTAGKRIVEKLRSDVKGLKNALRRSRKDTRTKESFERAGDNSRRKVSTKNHSILRRMSHVQSSDEYEVNNDVDQSPIGAGLPLLQRLKLLKEKQEKERDEKERSKPVICSGSQTFTDAETVEPNMPFTQKIKLLRQKESNTREPAVVSSTVRTQVTGCRFEKSSSRTKACASLKEIEKTSDETKTEEEANALKPAKSSEAGIFSFKEKLKLVHTNQGREKVLPVKIIQESEASPPSNCTLEANSVTSAGVPLVKESENSLSKLLGNKFEIAKSKEAWKLLKKSSISCPKSEKKLGDEDNKLIIKVSKKGAYISKSDTVLEKQKTVEKEDEKRSRSVSPSDCSKSPKKTLKQSFETLMSERKRSKSEDHSLKVKEDKNEENREEYTSLESKDFNTHTQKVKMKKYNSISDLSPEYSGLPFVKKLKILNERQKLEELEKELLVRSVSLDVPERPTSNRGRILIRSQSEASTIELRNVNALNHRTELERKNEEEGRTAFGSYDEYVRPEPSPEFRKRTDDEKNRKSRIHSEGSIASPESNETTERRHLKSILKKLSAEDSTSDEDYTKGSTPKKGDSNDLKKLMRAPTFEGYAARHKKLTKSVTFDSDTLPSSPDTAPDQNLEKGFAPMSPTAILTLQLSNLSMIPIASPKKTNSNEEKRKAMEGKQADKETTEAEAVKAGKISEEEYILNNLDKEKVNPFTPSALQDVIETNFRMLPFIKSLSDEFFAELKAEILELLQKVLGEAQNTVKFQFCDLQAEMKNKDEIILQLRSKIRELEVKSNRQEVEKSSTEVFEQNADTSETDPDVSDVPFSRGGSFETIRGLCSPTVESFGVFVSPRSSSAAEEHALTTEETEFLALPESDDFQFHRDCSDISADFSRNVEDELEVGNCHFTSRSQSARNIIKQRLKCSSDERTYEEEREHLESPRFFSADFITKKHKLKKNFSLDGTQTDATSNCTRRDYKTYKKSKESIINQVTELQRSFSCSLNKTSDFVALNIDDSPNSSDVDDLCHKDWEVQMLIKELAKKDPNWKVEEEGGWISKNETEVERLNDMRKLQEEVNSLKQMVCESDLTRLSSYELDVLETILEAKDQKLSQLAKLSSLSEDEKSKTQKSRTYTCSSGSDKLKNDERRKKPWLRGKIGQALSFDFHDIEKPKWADISKPRSTYLKKHKTISGSRREHQSLYNLWHTSSRLKKRVLEDSDRVIKSMTIGRSSAAGSSRSSLPILASSPREKISDIRMSLPLLSSQELRANFTEHLRSSFSSPEEGHQETELKQSCDSVFTDLELTCESGQKTNSYLNRPSTSGLIKPIENHSSNSLNSFIKSVSQKMKQVMVGDSSANRKQVPTISRLCDTQTILKEAEIEVTENLKRGAETRLKENERIFENEPTKIVHSDHNPKTDPPDL